MFKSGVIIGKFLPYHKGHRSLIQRARAQTEHLTVLVCTLAREPIPGELRFQWVRDDNPGVRVLHVTDENPQYPNEHPDFWKIWKDTILSRESMPYDVLFTSEDYGDRLASEIGTAHVQIDVDRAEVPISGTEIRENPSAHWDFIPDHVKPFFVKKIVITGPESTGKSTLAENLAQYFNTQFVPEYGRHYLDAKGRAFAYEDFIEIARGHAAIEDHLTTLANRVLILDTDIRITRLFCDYYCEKHPTEIDSMILARRENYDLHLLMLPDVPWVPDWQRDSPEIREVFLELIRKDLSGDRISYCEIDGTFEKRFETAQKLIQRIIETPMRPR